MAVVRGLVVRGRELDVERPGRTADETLLLRLPTLARAFRAAWSRLPVRSRLRRALLVRIIRQGLGAVNRRDFDVLFLGFDPEIEYRMPGGGSAFMPDLADHHHGHEAYRAVWQTILESFADLRATPEELIDLGEVLVATTVYIGTGAGSGVPISQRLHQVFTLRNGLVIKQEDFQDRDEALAAAAAEVQAAPSPHSLSVSPSA